MLNSHSLGYSKPLYILPFDHRASFAVKYLGLTGVSDLTEEQRQQIKNCRQLVYEGFEKAITLGVPKNEAAFLTDEEFGLEVLKDAVSKGYIVCQTTEKSGQKEFKFEYDQDFGAHINAIKPTFTKALLIYNPEEDVELNKRQRNSIKQLCEFSHSNGYKVLVEPLVHATPKQSEKVNNDRKKYDIELRPKLTEQMLSEFNADNIDVDVWKIEGMYSRSAYEQVVQKARSGGRSHVGIVILGRAESNELVELWLRECKGVEGVVGFAIGRTICYEPLLGFRDGVLTREEAIQKIAENYLHFYKVFAL